MALGVLASLLRTSVQQGLPWTLQERRLESLIPRASLPGLQTQQTERLTDLFTQKSEDSSVRVDTALRGPGRVSDRQDVLAGSVL